MVDLASFACKKWTLFTLCLIGILVTLIVTIVACKVIEDMDPPKGSTPEEIKQWPDVKVILKSLF